MSEVRTEPEIPPGVWDVAAIVEQMRSTFRLPGVGSQYVAILSPTTALRLAGKRPGKGIGWRRYRREERKRQACWCRARSRDRRYRKRRTKAADFLQKVWDGIRAQYPGWGLGAQVGSLIPRPID